jgi:hypothetical protein
MTERAPDAAQRFCGALLTPGSILPDREWVPVLRCSVKNAAPCPGHVTPVMPHSMLGSTRSGGL